MSVTPSCNCHYGTRKVSILPRPARSTRSNRNLVDGAIIEKWSRQHLKQGFSLQNAAEALAMSFCVDGWVEECGSFEMSCVGIGIGV
jgi:hypothetical protein